MSIPSRFNAALLLFFISTFTTSASESSDTTGSSGNAENSTLPFFFEANAGQFDPSVKFLNRGRDFDTFLTADGPVIALARTSTEGRIKSSQNVLRLKFVGGNPSSVIEGAKPTTFTTSYFKGGVGESPRTEIQNFNEVRTRQIYPGVDVLYYGNGGELEYDLKLSAGTDPKTILLQYDGADRMKVDPSGNIIVTTGAGSLVQQRPVAYQVIDGVRRSVTASYRLRGRNLVTFELGKYDDGHALIIDPILSYSMFLWGSGTTSSFGTVRKVAADSAGNAYVVGSTTTADFPLPGSYQAGLVGSRDAYVLKMDPTGTKIIYLTYFGGRRAETYGRTIAVDSTGNAYITGTISACALPLTASPFQSSCDITTTGKAGFFAKLNSAGNALVYSSYFNRAETVSTAVSSAGNLYMFGKGTNLSATAGAFQAVSKSGSSSLFVAKLNTGGSLAFLTHLGGSPSYYSENAGEIALDSSGNPVVTGNTYSQDFPLKAPIQSVMRGEGAAFVTKLNSSGSALLFSTFLDGSSTEFGQAVAVSSNGDVYVGGRTQSDDFPTTPNAYQESKLMPGQSGTSGFVTSLSADGSRILMSTFLSSSGCRTDSSCATTTAGSVTAVGVDAAGFIYAAGDFSQGLPLVDSITDFGYGPSAGHNRMAAVVKLRPNGQAVVYATVLGTLPEGRIAEFYNFPVAGFALGPQGSVFVVGSVEESTTSFSATAGALKATGNNYLFKLSTGKYPTVVRSSANPVATGQSVTFTADVQSTILGGTVTFSSGDTVLGTALVNQGSATLTVPTLNVGGHKVTAVYSGDNKVSPIFYQAVLAQ